MPAPEPHAFVRVAGLRVVADGSALDRAQWIGADEDAIIVLRLAPDEVIAIRAGDVRVDDEHAIVEPEAGLVLARCSLADVEPHVEWPLPSERPAFAQGAVAGVPARLLIHDEGSVDVCTWAAYADELAERLGWSVDLDPVSPP